MRSLKATALFCCLLSEVLSQTDVCPTEWNVACSRPITDFTKQKNPRQFCKQIGMVAGDNCVITPIEGVIPNGCCENGK